MSEPACDYEILEHVKEFWESRKPHSPIYTFLLSGINITHASAGLLRARLMLNSNHMNAHNSIHGSVSATLIDWVGGMVIATHDKRTKTGVSVDIHISYVSTAREHDVIEIEARTDKVGGTLAFTSAKISLIVDGKVGPVVATGSHTKFVKV